MNLYAYVGNDPVNATDPSGMVQVLKAELAGQVNLPAHTAVRATGGVHVGRDQYGQWVIGTHGGPGFGQSTALPSVTASGGFSCSLAGPDEVAGSSASVAPDVMNVGPSGLSTEGTLALDSESSGSFSEAASQMGEVGIEVGTGTLGSIGVSWMVDQTFSAQVTIPGSSGLEFDPESRTVNFEVETRPRPRQSFSFKGLLGIEDPGL